MADELARFIMSFFLRRNRQKTGQNTRPITRPKGVRGVSIPDAIVRPAPPTPSGEEMEDAISALVGMGLKKKLAKAEVYRVWREGMATAEIIRAVFTKEEGHGLGSRPAFPNQKEK